jgi:hypothetical protein
MSQPCRWQSISILIHLARPRVWMGSFEPLERGDVQFNTSYVNLWFLVQNALVLHWIDFWYLSRRLEALLFSTSLSPYSFDAYL